MLACSNLFMLMNLFHLIRKTCFIFRLLTLDGYALSVSFVSMYVILIITIMFFSGNFWFAVDTCFSMCGFFFFFFFFESESSQIFLSLILRLNGRCRDELFCNKWTFLLTRCLAENRFTLAPTAIKQERIWKID